VQAEQTSEDLKNQVKGWGLADSIIRYTARKYRGKVATGDEHLRELDEAVFIKK